mmetsp:Transcript_20160/g.41463  ORF Transcript_20160/g.41463 Transcript_20160/m.41463 type:complete len:318 (-) Transcript_20160:1-954(-)
MIHNSFQSSCRIMVGSNGFISISLFTFISLFISTFIFLHLFFHATLSNPQNAHPLIALITNHHHLLQLQPPKTKQGRTIHHQRLVLPSFPSGMHPPPSMQVVQGPVVPQTSQISIQMLLGKKARRTGHADQHGFDAAVVENAIEEGSLAGHAPQVGEGRETEALANVFYAGSLVRGEDGSRGDRFDFGVGLLDGLKEMEEVFHFVVAAFLVHQRRVAALAANLADVEGKSHALFHLQADGLRSGGLVHVGLFFEVFVVMVVVILRRRKTTTTWSQVGAADQFVAVAKGQEGGVDGVLASREEGHEFHVARPTKKCVL